jgi:hypothetical protein
LNYTKVFPKTFLLIVTLLIASTFYNFGLDAVNAKANNEKVQQLLKDEYEFDLTRLVVVRENSDKPEIIVLEDIQEEEGYVSSKLLREKNNDFSKNQKRLEKLESKLVELLNDKSIKHVQPDYLYTNEVWSRDSLLDTPDDFDLTPLPATGNHWYYEKSNLRSLWYEQDCFNSGVGCGGSSDVVVAVIDTGLAFQDYTSVWEDVASTPFDFDPAPDMFVGDSINLWTNSGETPNNDIDDDGNGFIDDYHGVNMENYFYCNTWGCSTQESGETGHPDDDGGHGTFVTGLIASLTGNGTGSVSPAANVQIMTIKANYSKTPSFGSSRLVESINYAVDNGANIINLSLAGSSYDALLEEAVNNAHDAGVLIIASSGNSSSSVQYPARFANVVAVGAVNANDSKSNYSSYGPELDLVAYVGQGTGQGTATYQTSYSCFTAGTNCYNSTDLTRYKQFSNQYAIGTSFAAPQVAAAAAIILGNNFGMSSDELRIALGTATNDINVIGRDDQTGVGVIDFHKAFLYSSTLLTNSFFSEYIVNSTSRGSWLITANPSDTDDLFYMNKIKDEIFGPYQLKPGERKSISYSNLSPGNLGPVEVIASGPAFSTQVSKVGSSYYQVHGMDLTDLSNEYYFPEYIVNSFRGSWLVFGNPATSVQNAIVNIVIGDESKGPYTLIPGARNSLSFSDLTLGNLGPVKISANINIFASQINSVNGSFNQIQGIKVSELTNNYFYPEYIVNPSRQSWIIVGNPSATLTANVNIEIGGVSKGPYEILPGERISKIYYDLDVSNKGPVSVTSDNNVYTSQVSSVNGNYYQMVGLIPANFTTSYYYPEYIVNSSRRSWIVVGNPSTSQTISVDLTVGSEVKGPYQIAPGNRISQIYYDLQPSNLGPVVVDSTNAFYTIQVNSLDNSFYVVPGM